MIRTITLALASLIVIQQLHAQKHQSIEQTYSLAAKYMKSNPDSSWYYLKQTLEKSYSEKNVEKEFTARLLQRVLYGDAEQYRKQDSIVAILNSLESKVRPELQVFYLQSLGSAFHGKNEIEKGKKYYEKALGRLDTSFRDYKKLKITLFSNLALCSKQQEDFGAAIEYNLKGLELDPHHPHICTQLGNLFKRIKEPTAAKHYYRLCIKNEDENVKNKHMCLKGLQNLYESQNQLDSSYVILLHLLNRPKECYRSTYFHALTDYASHLIRQNPDSILIDSIFLLCSHYKGKNVNRAYDLHMSLADLSKHRGKWTEASRMYLEAIEGKYQPFESVDLTQRSDLMFSFFETKTLLGQPIDHEFLAQWRKVSLERYDADLAASLVLAKRKFDLESKEREVDRLSIANKLKQSQLQLRNRLIWIILFALTGLALLAFVLNQHKKSLKREAKLKDSELINKQTELDKQELLKKLILTENIHLQSKQIALEERLKALQTDPSIILNSHYAIGTKKTKVAFPCFRDILYVKKISGQKNKTAFYVKEDEKVVAYPVTISITQIENQEDWPESIFYKTHQSCIVNIYNISSDTNFDGELKMKNGDLVPLAQRRIADLKKYLLLRQNNQSNVLEYPSDIPE